MELLNKAACCPEPQTDYISIGVGPKLIELFGAVFFHPFISNAGRQLYSV
jgi:hypothetical protein